MDPKTIAAELKILKAFFDRSTACLEEKDSSFAPVEGVRTAAQQVAHTAQTVEWFFTGAFRPEGFDMNFETIEKETAAVASLAAAREWVERAFAMAERVTFEHSAEEWAQPLPEGGILGGQPRFVIVGALNDHTAHHRGALTVYSRLRGHVPAMPYM